MINLTRWQRPQLAAWPPFGRLFGLREDLDRLFESSFGESGRVTQFLNVWNPAVDLYEDKDNLVVKAEIPGMKKEDIQISLQDGVLNISGERKSGEKPEAADTHRAERFVGRFSRSLTLPTQVNGAKVAAQYQDGILTVTLPKAEEAKPKKIEVNVN